MVIIFDLDGTILDTYKLIRQNFIEVFDKFLPEHKYTEEELESYFGPSLIESFMKVVNNEELANKLIFEYRKVSDKNHHLYLNLFPFTEKALKIFKQKGYKLAIQSNKLHHVIIQGLKLTNIYEYFDYIVGFDDVINPKPNREGIDKIINFFNDDDCVFVGDSIIDIKTAQSANIKSIGCTWAITKKQDFISAKANYIVDNFLELIKLMEEQYV